MLIAYGGYFFYLQTGEEKYHKLTTKQKLMDNYLLLQSKIEQFIIDNQKVNICAIKKEFKEEAPEDKLSSIISLLVLRNCWKTVNEKGRLFITCNTAIQNKVTTVKHAGQETEIRTKVVPLNGDWIVISNDSDSRLFFDSHYSIDEVRGAFAKTEKVNFGNVRVRKYQKTEVLIEAKNW